MRLWLPAFALILALLVPHSAHARTEEEKQDLEEQRIEQALENLGSSKADQIENACYKFEQMGEDAVPRLVKLIHEGDRLKTINGIYALGRLGVVARQAVVAITPFLKAENDPDMQAVTAIALGKIGPASKDAVPILDKMQYEANPWVSKSAHEALKKIHTEEALKAMQIYEQSLKSDSGKQ